MKSEKILAAINFDTESCRYHKSFVSYRAGNLLICDHRQAVINSFESSISVFKELLNKPALVQAMKDKNGFRINLYDIDEVEVKEPKYVLKITIGDYYFSKEYKQDSVWSFNQETILAGNKFVVLACLKANEKNVLK